MKHTPGPWIIDKDKPAIIHANYFRIEQVLLIDNIKSSRVYTRATEIEAEANARLIAAAPDLLEQLQNIIFAFSSSAQSDIQKAAIKYANDAILKATK